MKKLIIAGLLLTALLGIPAAGQYPQQQDRNRPRQETRQYPNQWERRDNQVQTRTEYRYVNYRGMVYKETYRTTYTRNGNVINRILVRRERVSDRDRRKGFRFNIFIPFG